MNHLHHEDIPEGILFAARQLQEYAVRNGWGGFTGDGLWSLEGIGPVSPYEKRIYELEGRLNHIEQAYINSDRLRTEYQLQVEMLHDAVKALERYSGNTPNLNLIRGLVEIVKEQRKTNQP